MKAIMKDGTIKEIDTKFMFNNQYYCERVILLFRKAEQELGL